MRRNIAALFGWQIAQYIIPLLTLPYLARVLGVSAFGELALGTGLVTYAVIFSEWGFALTATQQISANRNNDAELCRIFWNTIFAKLVLAVPVLGISIALVYLVPQLRPVAPVYLVLASQVIAGALTVNWYLQGTENMLGFTVASMVGRVAAIPPVFLLVHSPNDLIWAAALQSVGSFISAFISLWLVPRSILSRRTFVSVAHMWRQLQEGWHVFVSQAAAVLYTQTNVVILSLMCGNAAAGIYSGSERIRRAGQGLLQPISAALYPRISHLARTDPASAFRLARNGLKAQLAIALCITIGLSVLARPVVLIMLGAKFSGAVPVIRTLAFIPMASCISNVAGIQIMIPFGHKQAMSRIALTAGCVNLIVMPLLAGTYGALGGAMALVIAECGIAAAMAIFVVRRYGARALI